MLAFALFVSLCFSVAEAEYVKTLTSENFTTFLAEKAEAFVAIEYYAPWCGHCKQIAPHWEAAAEILKDEDIILTKVDGTENEELSSSAGVQGFPTIKLHRGSAVSDYNGPRDSGEAIAEYLRKKSGPAAKAIATAEEMEALKGDVVILGLFEAGKDKDFQAAASGMSEDAVFGTATDASLFKDYQVTAPAVVLKLNFPFDTSFKVMDGELTTEKITEFVKANWIPALSEIGPANYGKYPTSKPMMWFFANYSADTTKATQETLLKICKGAALTCVYLDGEKYADHGENMGVKEVPGIAIISGDESEQKFVYGGEFTEDALSKFVSEFQAGTLKATIKSEAVPAKNDGPVTVVVADNFEEIVLKSGKDVAIEFYAPWCGHCKKLTPEWEALGEMFADVDDLVIAKMDATANDVDKKYGVSGFPTLKFFKADDVENPIDIDAGRNTADLAKFIQKTTTKKMDSLPVNHEDVQQFLDGYSDFADNAKKLIAENKALKEKVASLKAELEELKTVPKPAKAEAKESKDEL